MEIDKNMLEKLKSMSDDDLKLAISEVANAFGASERQKQKLLGNAGAIKRKISGASQKDLSRLVGSLGDDKTEEIMRKLKL